MINNQFNSSLKKILKGNNDDMIQKDVYLYGDEKTFSDVISDKLIDLLSESDINFLVGTKTEIDRIGTINLPLEIELLSSTIPSDHFGGMGDIVADKLINYFRLQIGADKYRSLQIYSVLMTTKLRNPIKPFSTSLISVIKYEII